MKKLYFKKSLCAVLVCCISVFLFSCTKSKNTEKAKENNNKSASASIYNPLTGDKNLSAEAVGKRPIAVVMNNAPAARPQWGLCTPDIVVEGITEAGITRMLCLYSDVNSIPKFGSVRSARHDFIEVAEGFDAIFVHWGGSVPAYEAIKSRNIKDIDGITNGKYFAKDNSRKVGTEHRGYTTGKKIKQAITDLKIRKDINSAYSAPFEFSSTPEKYDTACKSIKVSFSTNYNHTFKYNDNDKLYYNYMNSKKMVDSDGKQMSRKNIIILYIPSYKIINSYGSVDMDLTGGDGIIASNGTCKKITWKKGNKPSNMISIYNEDGSKVKLNVGQNYIGLVPSNRSGNTTIVSK